MNGSVLWQHHRYSVQFLITVIYLSHGYHMVQKFRNKTLKFNCTELPGLSNLLGTMTWSKVWIP